MKEERETPEQDYLRSLVLRRLKTSKLSLRQHARKWDISSSLLSQIKNKKRRVGLDLALKVMRDSQVPLSKQKEIVNKLQANKNKELAGLNYEVEAQVQREYLSSTFSKLLLSYPFAVDIFLDIALSESEGCTVARIMKRYGLNGIQLADMFSESDVVAKVKNRYYIQQIDALFSPSKLSLFELINLINERLRAKVAAKKFRGMFNLEVREITLKGIESLERLQQKHVAEVRQLLDENEVDYLSDEEYRRISLSVVTGEI